MAEILRCGSCGERDLAPVLDMGNQPLAEHDNGKRYPLKLLKCTSCTLVQLSYIPDEHEMFPPDHPFATGNTRANHVNAEQLASQANSRLSFGDVIVDIGANDGTLLSKFSREIRCVAVEPTNQAVKCRDQGFRTWQQFFTSDTAKDILSVCGPAKVITACNVLAHVPDPHDFLTGVLTLLADDGVFITENHDWASIANGLQIDTVYHEHLRFYSVASLSRLLAFHGLLIDDMKKIPAHGGSFRTFAVREKGDLAKQASRIRGNLGRLMEIVSKQGPIYGIGACTRATPLINYTGIASYLTCVCEVPQSEKIGTLIPGTEIPVVDEKKLFEDQPPYALLLSWHIAQDIMPKLREKGYKGKFIIPLPEARIYG
jgi:hypothetical protein